MTNNFKGGFACVTISETIPAAENIIIDGIGEIITKAVSQSKPILMQNVTLENIGTFTGYVTFMRDETNDAYIGSLCTATDYDGNGAFASIFLVIGDDDYVWFSMIDNEHMIPAATTSKAGLVKKCSKVNDATSETIVAQFNDLLAKMKTAGMMSGS